MMNPLSDIFRLFFPSVCASCGEPLPDGGGIMCTGCRFALPLTGFWNAEDNPVARKFDGHLILENASSYFFFVEGSGYREIIHKFKYKGGWRLAEEMGRWFGTELAASGNYSDVDVVVPVPLHIRRLLSRGYNQAEYVARGIASSLGKPVDTTTITRTTYNQSQTSRGSGERWDNVQGIFSAKNPTRLQGKHILLVDDVLTTGATIISCGETILKEVPDCRLSIATLAVSRGES